jgi:hypothetical protein
MLSIVGDKNWASIAIGVIGVVLLSILCVKCCRKANQTREDKKDSVEQFLLGFMDAQKDDGLIVIRYRNDCERKSIETAISGNLTSNEYEFPLGWGRNNLLYVSLKNN